MTNPKHTQERTTHASGSYPCGCVYRCQYTHVARKHCKLHAAAPELLERLAECAEELRQIHEQVHPDCIADRPKRCPSRAEIEMARAAIRKAEEAE